MKLSYGQVIAAELKLQPQQVAAVAALLEEGGTVPFIARYRKEATGSLDEVAIAAIRDRLEQLAELDKRRESILASLEERSLLTPELQQGIYKAATLTELEDIYLPYRPKRRTRTTIAREKGLEPLALLLLEQGNGNVEDEAARFVDPEKQVASADEALSGARDIIAEIVSENQGARTQLRALFNRSGQVKSKLASAAKEQEGAKFRDYFDWAEPISKAPSHRLLAILRGENEGFLSVSVEPEEGEALATLESIFLKGRGEAAEQVQLAIKDSWKRLLLPSLETETRNHFKKLADEKAIQVFAANLRELLLAAPLGQRNTMAIDPGFRTGCKVVCLDAQGKLLHHDVIYLLSSQQVQAATDLVRKLCLRFSIQAIAIGNGTGGRETEAFVKGLGLPAEVAVVMVNESGASIYSASDVAREEFPDQDVTVRGAVSIGRRLMDPLAELVKLEPRSIGVGQYQHDVDQGELKKGLDDVVLSCVNAVGVEVNTASRQLLSYVSGLGPQLAGNIVKHRDENGPFATRAALRKVPRLGPKAFEQAAGFLRVRGGKDPLDASAVHPESYPIVKQMATDLGCKVEDLIRDAERRRKIDLSKYVTDKVGLPTLTDILAELDKPGRDPREQFQAFSFAEGINKIDDLTPGMKLPGVITNVTAFGAFVDIGVHQDGLVHASQLADQFVKDPAEVVKVQQRVMVTVLDVDPARKRISLSMKAAPVIGPQERSARPSGGQSAGPAQRPAPAGQKPRENCSSQPPPPKPAPKPSWFTDALAKAKTK